jgi:hypothetical protein
MSKIWWRHEYHHIHALIWINGKTTAAAQSMEHIRGSIDDLVREDKVESLVAEGILVNAQRQARVREKRRKIMRHTCSQRCKRRVGVKDGKTSG